MTLIQKWYQGKKRLQEGKAIWNIAFCLSWLASEQEKGVKLF